MFHSAPCSQMLYTYIVPSWRQPRFISRSKGQVQKIASFTTSRNFQICRFRKKVGKSVPLQAWSGPEGSRKLSFPDFVTAAQDGGKVVSLTHRPPYPQEILLVLISVRGWVDLRAVVASGRILCRWKFPMTQAGIELAIFRFVAQHLNHCATAVPSFRKKPFYFSSPHIPSFYWFYSVCFDVQASSYEYDLPVF